MHITKFFYNVQTKECEFFVYSGCGGNANNFLSVLECEQRCKKGSALLVEIPANGKTKNHAEVLPGRDSNGLFSDSRRKLLQKAVVQSRKRTLLSDDNMLKSKVGILEPYLDDMNLPESFTKNELKAKVSDAVSEVICFYMLNLVKRQYSSDVLGNGYLGILQVLQSLTISVDFYKFLK